MPRGHILTLSCEDRPGLVAAVSGMLAENGGNITDAQQFNDSLTGRFFMRIVFDLDSGKVEGVRARMAALARNFAMTWKMRPASQRMKVILLVSRFDHCFADLLYRCRLGELEMELVAAIGNHPQSELQISRAEEIPYHFLPVTRDDKAAQEGRIKRIIEETGAELVVLARYMQILSDDLATFLSGRCINIHHSFLPGFKGAKPYHQAYERGVKMIGATAHYVTPSLDEGPIINQDVEHISHADTPDDLVRKGRDIERRVLARAVGWHLQDRVLLNGSKTVVFRD